MVKTGTNQDGRAAQPITAPSTTQQEQLLESIYDTSGVDPASIQYIEAHGMLLTKSQLLSGPSCSKLTSSLVNDSLKFTSSDTQIC